MWTQKELAMAKAGYVYQAKTTRLQSVKGLRPTATDLEQYTRNEVIFDHDAYDCHQRINAA